MNNRKAVKYYAFSAGKLVPSWMIDIVANDRVSLFKSKGSKLVFGTSCVVVRFLSGWYKVMPSNNKITKDGIVYISGVFNSTINVKRGVFPINGQGFSSIGLGVNL